jgi:hypothetical protein
MHKIEVVVKTFGCQRWRAAAWFQNDIKICFVLLALESPIGDHTSGLVAVYLVVKVAFRCFKALRDKRNYKSL